MARARYPTDLTEAQWQKIRAILSSEKGRRGRLWKCPVREIWNAIFYQARAGCSWHMLPHDLPPWTAVWFHFRRWRLNGTLERVHDALRDELRRAEGHEPSPSATILDSHSVKTTEKGGQRLRSRQEGKWQKAPRRGRYSRADPCSLGTAS